MNRRKFITLLGGAGVAAGGACAAASDAGGGDDFRNGTLAECKDRCAARHRLDHYQAEWLRPIDREQKCLRLAQEFGLTALIDLAVAQQRCDLFAEIDFIEAHPRFAHVKMLRPVVSTATISPSGRQPWPR